MKPVCKEKIPVFAIPLQTGFFVLPTHLAMSKKHPLEYGIRFHAFCKEENLNAYPVNVVNMVSSQMADGI
jgi:hypothetical protein